MHAELPPSENQSLPGDPSYRWYRELSRYHWFVLIVAALGWLFDCLDQQLFILARPAAMSDLLSHITDAKELQLAVAKYGDIATSVFIAGWATGGLIFGMLGDRIGRAKTMMITILMYSAFTGLSALSVSVYDFAFYRFLTGLGVGGEFAVGVALVAEVMPSRARPYALSLLQALSAIGNVSAALINMGLGIAEGEGFVSSPWRIMFCIGALPAFLSLVIRRRLKEPEAWQKAQQQTSTVAQKAGSYRELFSHPVWRKHALLGLVLACSGVIGLWAVGFYTPDLIRQVQTKPVTDLMYSEAISEAEAADDATRLQQLKEVKAAIDSNTIDTLQGDQLVVKNSVDRQVKGKLSIYQSLTSIAINFGAFLGMFSFGVVSQVIGRRKTFAIALLAAFFSTVCVFWFLTDLWQIFVLVPVMGFCQLSLFGGYAVYFPELFPTHLRSTGTSFCYNVGRFVAALGPLVKIYLNDFFKDTPEPLRYAGVTMCLVFLIGLFVLPFLPETLGKDLPE